MARFQKFGVAWFIVTSFVLSSIAGALSWRYVEAPVLNWIRCVRAKRERARLSENDGVVANTGGIPVITPSEIPDVVQPMDAA